MDYTEGTLKAELISITGKAKKHFAILLIAFVIPLVISVFIGYRDFPIYNTKMLIRMSLLSGSELSYFFKSYQDLLNAQDYTTIEKKFFISEKHSSKIRRIWIEKLKDKSDGYIINLSCCDIDCIKPVEEGIGSFMRNESDANEKNKIRRKALITQIDSVNSQIAIMDTLVRSIRSNKGIATDIYPFYAASATMNLLHLYDLRNDLKEKLSTTVGYSIIDGFLIPEKPQTQSLTKFVIIGLIVGLVVCYFLLKEFLS